MPKKNCLNCIAYCNMLADGKCGLGFEVEEVTETSAGFSIVFCKHFFLKNAE